MNIKPFVPNAADVIRGSVARFAGRAVSALGLLALLAAVPCMTATAAEGSAPTLNQIDFAALSGNRVQLLMDFSTRVEKPTSFVTSDPARLVFDFPGVASSVKDKTKTVGVGAVQSVTTVTAGNRTRVVVNLVEAVPYETSSKGNTISVVLASGGAAVAAATRAAQGEPVLSGTTEKSISNIDFRRGPAGEGRVLVTLTEPTTVVDVREEGGKVVVDFVDTSLPSALAASLDVVDFATPVTTVDTIASGRNVRMTITAEGEYDHLAYQSEGLLTVEFRPLTKQEKEALKKQELVYTGERLSLNFQDIEVRAVLQLLADFTDLNLVTSDTVGGRITLRLKNVPWDQALDIILKTKGLSMRRTDNVILVAPTEEIAAREKLELESQQQIEELAPLRSEFIQVNYAKAADLADLLKAQEHRLLSERGNVTIDERTNTLLVQDTAAKLEEVRRLVNTLDIPVPQVLIESRIVIATDDFSRDLGVKFGFNAFKDKGDTIGAIGGGQNGDFNTPVGPIIEKPAGSGNESLIVNLPANDPSGSFNFFLGNIGSWLLRLELSAMQAEGKGEVISSPRVITADQTEASIKAGIEIPYQEASSSGATSVSFKEAVLELKVTPHITPDDRVLMELNVKKDNADFSRSVLGTPPLEKREVETTVLVDNGETVVLGGIYERNFSKSSEKVPLFGDLPYVGFLFKQRDVTDTKTELLIFVTPKILKETLGLK